MSESTPQVAEELARAALDLHSGDASKVDAYAESVSRYDPSLPDRGVHGRDALEEDVRDVKAAFPDVQVTANDVLVDGDVVMLEFTWTGTHEGEYEGIPPSGREVVVRGMMKLEIADGKIREERGYYDLQGFLAQLGIAE